VKSFSFIILFFAIAGMYSCERDGENAIPRSGDFTRHMLLHPKCLHSTIAEISERQCGGRAKIEEYVFQDELVYLIDPGFCAFEQAYEVLNKHCEVIGILGTISGNYEIRGEGFENAKFIRLVWQN
jgi:Domain of unknown function (DUF6970)